MLALEFPLSFVSPPPSSATTDLLNLAYRRWLVNPVTQISSPPPPEPPDPPDSFCGDADSLHRLSLFDHRRLYLTSISSPASSPAPPIARFIPSPRFNANSSIAVDLPLAGKPTLILTPSTTNSSQSPTFSFPAWIGYSHHSPLLLLHLDINLLWAWPNMIFGLFGPIRSRILDPLSNQTKPNTIVDSSGDLARMFITVYTKMIYGGSGSDAHALNSSLASGSKRPLIVMPLKALMLLVMSLAPKSNPESFKSWDFTDVAAFDGADFLGSTVM
ncbi:hypothetical protein AALP_AAs40745U000100, partial [Arabis alpina]